MKIKILLVIILIFVFCIGGTASAMTDSERQALIQQLMNQIAQLQAQMQEILAKQQGISVTPVTESHAFNINLKKGDRNEEVSELQEILVKEGLLNIAQPTGYFWTATFAAVVAFQEKYASDILTPLGFAKGTGIVGASTRAKLNSLYSSAPAPQPQQQVFATCTPNWQCGVWSACATNNQQTRTCTDTNYCGVTTDKPAITQSCGITCTPSWSCANWTACSNNKQTKSCIDLNNCGVTTNKPATTQSCAYTPSTCTSFTYSSWGDCQLNSTMTRTVASSLPAGCTGGSPILSQSCTYVPPANPCTSFTYSNWSACQSNNTQSRTIATSLPAGCNGGNPILSGSCAYTPSTCTSFTYSSWGDCQLNSTMTRTVASSLPAGCTGGSPVLTQSCCVEQWQCTEWSACAWYEQIKTCTDANNCGTIVNKPATTQSCCEPYWQCTSWSACTNNQQIKTCTDANNCGTTTDMPATTKYCNSDIVSYTIDSKIADTNSLNLISKKPMYSTMNHVTGEFVRNLNCWAKDWNLSPVSPDNSRGYNGIYTRAPSTLISPRHTIMAQHASLEIGDTMKFVDMNNNIITRTLTGKAERVAGTDISIGLLDSDVPAGFSFTKILPVDWKNHLNISSATNKVPLFSFDQELKAIVSELSAGDSETWINNIPSSVSPRSLLWEDIASGDSGFPSFLIVNNELVVTFLYYNGGSSGGGPNIQNYKTQINTAMANLQGGSNPYQLTEINLDASPSY